MKTNFNVKTLHTQFIIECELKRSCFFFKDKAPVPVVRLMHYKFWALRFPERKMIYYTFSKWRCWFFVFILTLTKQQHITNSSMPELSHFFHILKYITMHAIWWITLFSSRKKIWKRVNISNSKYFLLFLLDLICWIHILVHVPCHMFMQTWRQTNFKMYGIFINKLF